MPGLSDAVLDFSVVGLLHAKTPITIKQKMKVFIASLSLKLTLFFLQHNAIIAYDQPVFNTYFQGIIFAFMTYRESKTNGIVIVLDNIINQVIYIFSKWPFGV